MIQAKGNPITASKPQMKPKKPLQGGGGPAAQSQIAAPPAPFQSAQNALNTPAPGVKLKSTGNGRKGRSAFYGG